MSSERMRFVQNGEYLEHIYIVDDPFALTEPYTMSRYHKQLPPNTPVEEKVCGDNPEGRRAWAKLFKPHPPRVERHSKRYGNAARAGQRSGTITKAPME